MPRALSGVGGVRGLVLALDLLAAAVGSAGGADGPADACVIRVDGLACPYGGYGIEKQFAQRRGVTETSIDLERGVVIVTVAPDIRFSDRELERIVHQAGFALGAIVRRPGGQ